MSDDKYATSKKIVRKVVVFDGDFRRILHVIPRGTLFEIVHITVNALYICDWCNVLTLTKNMRLQNSSSTSNFEDA